MAASPKIKRSAKTSILYLDLTKTFPRSPGEKLAGLTHIPRMTDKARALKNGVLGDYIYPCPLDEILLNFLGVSSDEFLETVITYEDKKVSEWTAAKLAGRSLEEKKLFNKEFLENKPDTEKAWEKFYQIRDNIDPSRTDIQTWTALIDLEEGRLAKIPASSS